MVTVEIRIISGTDQRMDSDGVPFDQLRLKSLNGQTVKGRSTVQKNRMLAGHFIQRIPYDRLFSLDHLFGGAHGVDLTQFLQTADDERFEENQSHLLG